MIASAPLTSILHVLAAPFDNRDRVDEAALERLAEVLKRTRVL